MNKFPANPDDVSDQIDIFDIDRYGETEDQIIYAMPRDSAWPEDFWLRIGEDPGFAELDNALAAIGAKIEEEDYDIVLIFPSSRRKQVLATIQQAQDGVFGSDVAFYWSQVRPPP